VTTLYSLLTGGGEGIYFTENIAFELRDDHTLSSDNLFECILIESLADIILIGCVYKSYRPIIVMLAYLLVNLLTGLLY